MKYLCLIYYDEKVLDALTREALEALWREAEASHRALTGSPGCLAAALEPSRDTITLRERGGKTFTTDGPFAETREQLGGLLLIDVEDLDDALDIAARVPAARFGSIEVRPVADLGHAQTARTHREESGR
ncbi:MAG: YciI family protein [Gammaproteobacteria bacterium]|nr:YciI family protein [Gammaproteobacteria bacterium]